MNWKDIFKIFKSGSNRIQQAYQPAVEGYFARLPFSLVIFNNIIEILTDLTNDTEWENTKGLRNSLFVDFKLFFDLYAKTVMAKLFHQGYVVIGFSRTRNEDGLCRLQILKQTEYIQQSQADGDIIVTPLDPNTEVCVLKSTTYQVFGKSDYDMLKPWLLYIDNCMSASNTSASRLGNLLIMSPASNNEIGKLTKLQREEMENYILENYGAMARQKQVLLLGQPMQTSVISMAGMDAQMEKKLKIAILAICDRVKVPANQVAIIDASSSKAFANGSELQMGDFQKYQSFERLLYQSFGILAEQMGLELDYTIYNKPKINAI